MLASAGSEGKTFVFEVKFRPKQGWVDEEYLGNYMVEILGAWARRSDAFEFELEKKEG